MIYWILKWFGVAVKKELPQPPHERWPEILHWQAGDKFNSLQWTRRTQYTLVALDDDGYAAVDFCGEREWVKISLLVGHNCSLRTRRVNKSLAHSREYMELITEFQRAYKELEKRDQENLRLAG